MSKGVARAKATTHRVKTRYEWANPFFAGKADADEVGQALAPLQRSGELEPSRVVSLARDPDSVLHPLFEWDDTKAAAKHRRQQASNVIRAIRIVTGKGEAKERHRFAFRIKTSAGPRYVDPVDVPVAAAVALNIAALRALEHWAERYKELSQTYPEAYRDVRKAAKVLRDGKR